MSVAKAVVLGLDGYERVILVSEPPPTEWLLPVSVGWVMSPNIDYSSRANYETRRFQLRRDVRSLNHRWQKMSESGRSCTLEPGYVYMEIA